MCFPYGNFLDLPSPCSPRQTHCSRSFPSFSASILGTNKPHVVSLRLYFTGQPAALEAMLSARSILCALLHDWLFPQLSPFQASLLLTPYLSQFPRALSGATDMSSLGEPSHRYLTLGLYLMALKLWSPASWECPPGTMSPSTLTPT